MFGNITKDLAKLDVLESKLNIYESLSREMLDKLENAVDKISESNQRIANILAKHDERIDQSIKTDELIVKMIEDVKHQNSVEHRAVIKRIETVESTVSELSKFKWQAAALVGAAILLVGLVVPFVDNMLGMAYNGRSEQTQLK
jgi:ABC-type transport system involved in cytochrome bd biosynthesis fused ATPase/permease subunit